MSDENTQNKAGVSGFSPPMARVPFEHTDDDNATDPAMTWGHQPRQAPAGAPQMAGGYQHSQGTPPTHPGASWELGGASERPP